MSIKDIIEDAGLKGGDSFYLSFYYGCDNGSTASSVSACLEVNGTAAASQILASDVYGANNKQTLYAEIRLPDTLPEQLGTMDLILITTKADRLYFKDIVISKAAE